MDASWRDVVAMGQLTRFTASIDPIGDGIKVAILRPDERDLVTPPCGGLTHAGQRAIDAAARQVEQDKALREPPTASVEPGSAAMPDWHARQLAERVANGERATVPVDYADRRAAGEGGHGMAEPWRPTVGARVVPTLDPARSASYVEGQRLERAWFSGIPGVVIDRSDSHGLCFYVEHSNGGRTWWDVEELAPAPEGADR